MCPPTAFEFTDVANDDDIRTWISVYNGVTPCRPEGFEEVRHWWHQAPEWQAIVVWVDGAAVGVGHVERQHWVEEPQAADALIVVRPEFRRRGVGTELFRRLSGWAAQRGLLQLDVWVDQVADRSIAYWNTRGFVEVGRERVSHLDLPSAELTPIDPPDGVRLVTMADGGDDFEHRMFELAREGFADIPSPDRYDTGDFEHWRVGELRLPGLLPECSVIALAGDEVVGFATIVRHEANPEVAEHEMTMVARAWRGRGLARAMKRRTAQLAAEAGLSTLESMNEGRNDPILAVNAKLGYVPITDLIQLRGPVAS